jgi:large subunit ribosomal protein L21
LKFNPKSENSALFMFLVADFNHKSLTFALQKMAIMFAVIKIAGQQFKVQPGQSLYVPHLGGEAGDKLEFSEILLHDNDGKISLGTDAKVTVKAEIVNELVKGEKVIAFKMKRRKGFRKKHGHRTQYTHIKVTDIA